MLLHNDHRLSKQTSACWRVPEYSRLSTCVQFSHLPCSTFTQTTYQSHLATILLTMTTSAVQCKLTLGKIAVDLAHLAQYCWRQCLKPSITKTVSSTFHLHNNRAGCELNSQCLKHNPQCLARFTYTTTELAVNWTGSVSNTIHTLPILVSPGIECYDANHVYQKWLPNWRVRKIYYPSLLVRHGAPVHAISRYQLCTIEMQSMAVQCRHIQAM